MWKEFKNKKGRFLLLEINANFRVKGNFIYNRKKNKFLTPDQDFVLPSGNWGYVGKLRDISFSIFPLLEKLVEDNGMGCWKNYLSKDPGNVYTCLNAYYSFYTFLNKNIQTLEEKNFGKLTLFFEPAKQLEDSRTIVPIYFQVDSKESGKLIGNAVIKEDGYYHFVPQEPSGHWSSFSLRYAADKLDELNKDWDDKVKESLNH